MTRLKPSTHVVIGPPGAFTLWVFDAIKLLAEHSETHTVQVIDRSDPLADDCDSNRIYLTQYPSLALIEAIANGRLQVIRLTESPEDSISYMMTSCGNTRNEALRALSASMVAHLAIAAAADTHTIPRQGDQPVRAYIRYLTMCLNLPHDEPTLDRVHDGLAAGLPKLGALETSMAARFSPTDDTAVSVDESTQAIIKKMIAPLALMADGNPFQPIIWPTDVFLSGDRPNEPAAAVASVMGPARVIFYGPYFHLPPADYAVEVILAFSGHIDEIPFALEIHGNSCLARARFERRSAGGYRGKFQFRHRNPVDAIEIHLRNEQGAIEGEVALVELRFLPLRPHFNGIP